MIIVMMIIMMIMNVQNKLYKIPFLSLPIDQFSAST